MPPRPAFDQGSGSNLTDYLGSAARVTELEAAERLIDLPVELIDPGPYQARLEFEHEELRALGTDIEQNGLNQPITVRRKQDGRYELIAGERRWLAARTVGLPRIAARLRQVDDFQARLIGISENNLRADLSPWEMSLQASELLEHAKEEGLPHAQRDLARYLNRNVSAVNQQLAIADALSRDLVANARIRIAGVCRLPHRALHRIAKLPAPQRARALKEAIRTSQPRGAASGEGCAPSPRDDGAAQPDAWTRLWERGGFAVRVRKPIREIEPARAREYLQELLPGIGGFAMRAAEDDPQSGALAWEHERGTLIFLRPAQTMSEEQCAAAREALLHIASALRRSPEENP